MSAVDTLYRAGERKVTQGDLAGARAIWRQLCELQPANVDHWLVLAGIDQQLGFTDSALQHLDYAKRLQPDDAELWRQSASLHWQSSRHQLALNDWHHALSFDIANLELRQSIAERAFECGQYAIAFTHLLYLNQQARNNPLADGLLVASLFFCTRAQLLSLSKETIQKLGREQSLNVAAQHLTPLVHPHKGVEKLVKKASKLIKDSAWFKPLLAKIGANAKGFFYHCAQFPQPYNARKKWLTVAAPQRYQALLEQIECNPQKLHHVYQLGCGTGQLAGQLRARGLRLCITGVDVSSNLRIIASNKNYDQLLNKTDWQRFTDLLLTQACLVIVSESAQYLMQQEINDLLSVNQNTLLCFESPTLGVIEAVRRQHDVGDVVSQAYKELLIVAAPRNKMAISNTLRARPRVITDLETRANKLIAVRQLLDQNQYEQAAVLIDQKWAADWENPDLLFVKGVIQQHKKHYTNAILFYRRAIHLNYGNGAFWFQLATVWQTLGRMRSMLRAYQRALRYTPNHQPSLLNLLVFWNAQQNWPQVFNIVSRLLHAYPLDDSLRANCDTVFANVGSEQIKQQYGGLLQSAVWLKASFNAAVERKYFHRSNVVLEQLTSLLPADEYQLLELSQLKKQGEVDGALALLKRALATDEDNLELQKQLRDIQLNSGDLEAASANWLHTKDKLDFKDANLQGGLFAANYFPWLTPLQLAQQHSDWGRVLEANTAIQPHNSDRPGGQRQKIRIAYLSGDIKFHSVSMFLHNIFKWHDRKRFELYIYMTCQNEDTMTIKLRSYGVMYRNIAQLSDDEAEQLIAKDNIDILIDLAGHTGYNRLPLMARKPAPIQCTYLGYANTTGLTRIDYRITDEQADPSDQDPGLHSEELIRLPSGFLSYSRHFDSPPVKPTPLNNNTPNFEFVCCNNILKVNTESVALFSKVLHAVPGSRLLIKAHNLDNAHIIKRYRKLFADQGIDKHRVHLMNALDMSDHQELYNHARIALDPSPYSGTTTTCDALWMGVPVLALKGQRHAARVSASILHRIGLDDWVAHSESEYVAKASEFIQQADRLALLKVTLRARMLESTLMSTTAVVRDLEAAYIAMVKKAG